jgi:hypothetical protein
MAEDSTTNAGEYGDDPALTGDLRVALRRFSRLDFWSLAVRSTAEARADAQPAKIRESFPL